MRTFAILLLSLRPISAADISPRSRSLSFYDDGPASSGIIDCSLASYGYEYYIELCHDDVTQWWINGRCANGEKEEVSELHRCAKSDGTRAYCHDCIYEKNGVEEEATVKHVCGSDNPNYDEVCEIALEATGADCGNERLKSYSHQCSLVEDEESDELFSTSSWYLRESFYCEKEEVHTNGPNTFKCGMEWYYPYGEDEHESGQQHPFATSENVYCLDCGLAIQVCASSSDATCATLGLPEKGTKGPLFEQNLQTTTATNKMAMWEAHAVMGLVIINLLLPSSIMSSDLLMAQTHYWMYQIHIGINLLLFTMTFYTVLLAFSTMNDSLGEAGEGHLKEVHHIVGLLLLLLISCQVAINTKFAGRKQQSFWYSVQTVGGVIIFSLGIYQCRSGLGLFAQRYNTMDYGKVYLSFILTLIGAFIVGMWCTRPKKVKKRNGYNGSVEIHTFRDPDNVLT